MCFGTDCPTCAKKTWRGCGQHIPQALSGVPEAEWCTCQPRVTVNGKEYPPAAKAAGMGSLFGGFFGGGNKTELSSSRLIFIRDFPLLQKPNRSFFRPAREKKIKETLANKTGNLFDLATRIMLPLRPLLTMWPVATPDSASAFAPSTTTLSSDSSSVSAPPSPRLHLSVFAALLVLFFVFIVPAVRSPLRHLPGPRLSRFTSAVLRWKEFQGKRTRYVHELHKRYGPVVRLAPSEVSFASAAAVKDIYGSAGSGYDKTDFYNLFTVYGRRTMFSTLNKENHAHRRRILADRYANTNVMKPSSLSGIETRSQVFAQLCGAAQNGTLDIYLAALHAYAFDCVTHHLFHPYGTDSLRNKDDEQIMREVTFDSSLQNRLISYHYPTLHSLTGSLLALFMKPRETPLARKFVLETSARPDPAPFTLLSRMNEKRQKEKEAEMAVPDVEKNANFDLLDAAAESMDHMAAGIDTTGDALCFLMWELSQPRSIAFQERLRRELLENTYRADPLPFDRLPLLDAIVQEGLRCFPAIPMSLPRVVPGQDWGVRGSSRNQSRGTGLDGMDGRVIDGFFLPAGTIVSSQAYSVHRLDRSVFPEPDTFNPDRWLTDDGDAERKRLFFAFASGGRGCVGKHLALAEMKLLLRDIYSRFATAPEASMTDEAMSMSDQIISTRPLGQRCLLKFIPLDELSKESASSDDV